jgi:rhomboid protease GluP
VFQRKTSGSVVCPSCGSLVGVRDEKCYMCGRSNPSLWGFAPVLRQLGSDLGFVPLVIGGCTIVYLLTLIASAGNSQMLSGGFSFLSPGDFALMRFGASGAIPIFVLGNWWSVLSASWLHGSLLHILFNMMSVRNIGPATADIIGPARTIIIYVVSGACGFLLSSFAAAFLPPIPFLTGARLTVGASASVLGLIGALVHYGRVSGSSMIRAQSQQWALMLILMGIFIPRIDNLAHIGGFIGGYVTSAYFNPQTRERGDHMLIAAICLVLSFAAIVASVVRGLPLNG